MERVVCVQVIVNSIPVVDVKTNLIHYVLTKCVGNVATEIIAYDTVIMKNLDVQVGKSCRDYQKKQAI